MLAGRRERRRSGIEASGHRRSPHARRGIRSGAKLIERLDMAQAKRASRVPVRWRLLCWPSRRPTDDRADDRMGRPAVVSFDGAHALARAGQCRSVLVAVDQNLLFVRPEQASARR